MRIATRGSALARWQAERVATLLGVPAELVIVSTRGDERRGFGRQRPERLGQRVTLHAGQESARRVDRDRDVDGPMLDDPLAVQRGVQAWMPGQRDGR